MSSHPGGQLHPLQGRGTFLELSSSTSCLQDLQPTNLLLVPLGPCPCHELSRHHQLQLLLLVLLLLVVLLI
jgi:hypothetical protein